MHHVVWHQPRQTSKVNDTRSAKKRCCTTKYSFKYIMPLSVQWWTEGKGKKVHKGVRWMPRLLQAMKDVISCDKLRVGANNPWSWDFRMGQPSRVKLCYHAKHEANAGNWNILVPVGRENKNDSPSSGERTGKSPNRQVSGPDGVVGPRRCMKECE